MLDRLQILHGLGFVHMDIKPDNILLPMDYESSSNNFHIKLIDFGMSWSYIDNDTGLH